MLIFRLQSLPEVFGRTPGISSFECGFSGCCTGVAALRCIPAGAVVARADTEGGACTTGIGKLAGAGDGPRGGTSEVMEPARERHGV